MRLRHLYSNQDKIFNPIRFRDGLNVVLGQIRRPEDRSEDTHNLGKTLLAALIDFCLLRRKSRDFFLFRYFDLFKPFVFFLELEVQPGDYVTVRRSVDRGSKASFMRHDIRYQDFSNAEQSQWDHWEAPFETAKELLDGMLGLTAISPWSFRHAIAYSLRTQRDFDEPFRLAKFAGRHGEWKPLLAHILGLDAELVEKNYELVSEVEEKRQELARLRAEAEGLTDRDKLRGLIAIREQEIRRHERRLNEYNFDIADADINRELVEELDNQISDLNERRYYLDSARDRTEKALQEKVSFSLDDVRQVFRESNIYFGSQIVKDYETLVAFNQAISEERAKYLEEELGHIRTELENIEKTLETLNARRSAALVMLKDREAFSKFRMLTGRLVEEKAGLESLRRQEAAAEAVAATRRELHDAERELDEIREAIEVDLANESDRYRIIRSTFNEFVSQVIGLGANLYTNLNQEGNPDFHAEIVDEQGRSTSGAEGHSYGRLLCIAFDVSVHFSYLQDQYAHFIYHDGLLETLDDRKKLNLIDAVRSYASAGIQHIVTVIDSELPVLSDGSVFSFEDEEVILSLHDLDATGRLFQMAAW